MEGPAHTRITDIIILTRTSGYTIKRENCVKKGFITRWASLLQTSGNLPEETRCTDWTSMKGGPHDKLVQNLRWENLDDNHDLEDPAADKIILK
jgi:hypothetical protein